MSNVLQSQELLSAETALKDKVIKEITDAGISSDTPATPEYWNIVELIFKRNGLTAPPFTLALDKTIQKAKAAKNTAMKQLLTIRKVQEGGVWPTVSIFSMLGDLDWKGIMIAAGKAGTALAAASGAVVTGATAVAAIVAAPVLAASAVASTAALGAVGHGVARAGQYLYNSRYGDIFKSIDLNNLSRVKALIEADRSNLTANDGGVSPISLAIEKNKTEIAIYLISELPVYNLNARYSLLVDQEYFNEENLKRGMTPQVNKWKKMCAPIEIACANSNIEVVKALIEKKVEINIITAEGETPLLIACKNGNEAIALALLEADADVFWVGKDGSRVSQLSTTMADVTRLLKAKFGTVDVASKENASLLFSAINDKDTKTILSLLHQPTDLTHTTPLTQHNTLLNCALEQNLGSVSRRLIEKGAPVNPITADTKSPTMVASAKGMTPIIKLLKEKGANIGYAIKGDSALLSAEDHSYTTAFLKTVLYTKPKQLAEKAAELAAARAHMEAADRALVEAYEANKADEVVRLIKEDGVDPTPIFIQLCSRYDVSTPGVYDIFYACAVVGVDINAHDPSGKPLLMLVKIDKATDTLISELVALGADLNATSKDGTTPLLAACTRADLMVADLEDKVKDSLRENVLIEMISLGGDVDKKDRAGKNLYDYCTSPVVIDYIKASDSGIVPPSVAAWRTFKQGSETTTLPPEEYATARPLCSPPPAYELFAAALPSVTALPTLMIGSSRSRFSKTRARSQARRKMTRRFQTGGNPTGVSIYTPPGPIVAGTQVQFMNLQHGPTSFNVTEQTNTDDTIWGAPIIKLETIDSRYRGALRTITQVEKDIKLLEKEVIENKEKLRLHKISLPDEKYTAFKLHASKITLKAYKHHAENIKQMKIFMDALQESRRESNPVIKFKYDFSSEWWSAKNPQRKFSRSQFGHDDGTFLILVPKKSVGTWLTPGVQMESLEMYEYAYHVARDDNKEEIKELEEIAVSDAYKPWQYRKNADPISLGLQEGRLAVAAWKASGDAEKTQLARQERAKEIAEERRLAEMTPSQRAKAIEKAQAAAQKIIDDAAAAATAAAANASAKLATATGQLKVLNEDFDREYSRAKGYYTEFHTSIEGINTQISTYMATTAGATFETYIENSLSDNVFQNIGRLTNLRLDLLRALEKAKAAQADINKNTAVKPEQKQEIRTQVAELEQRVASVDGEYNTPVKFGSSTISLNEIYGASIVNKLLKKHSEANTKSTHAAVEDLAEKLATDSQDVAEKIEKVREATKECTTPECFKKHAREAAVEAQRARSSVTPTPSMTATPTPATASASATASPLPASATASPLPASATASPYASSPRVGGSYRKNRHYITRKNKRR